VIVQCKSLFDLSIANNLDPTLEFFKECIGEEQAVNLLRKNPKFLTVSLEKRLKPRWEQAQQAGIKLDVRCIQRIVLYTEERWHISLDYQQSQVSSK